MTPFAESLSTEIDDCHDKKKCLSLLLSVLLSVLITLLCGNASTKVIKDTCAIKYKDVLQIQFACSDNFFYK